jgi:hypothetical protein
MRFSSVGLGGIGCLLCHSEFIWLIPFACRLTLAANPATCPENFGVSSVERLSKKAGAAALNTFKLLKTKQVHFHSPYRITRKFNLKKTVW